MNNYAEYYKRCMDGELLKLWRGRRSLVQPAQEALQSEIERRGLQGQKFYPKKLPQNLWQKAESQQKKKYDPGTGLAAPKRSYFNLTVFAYWVRELWLRFQTRNGTNVEATVISSVRSRHAYAKGRAMYAGRVDVLYQYEHDGAEYQGRAVRDFVGLSLNAANAMQALQSGEKVTVRINPLNPEISYYRTGFGVIEPVFNFFWGIFMWLVMLLLACTVLFLVATCFIPALQRLYK